VTHTRLWRRLDIPGHESVRLSEHNFGGVAVFLFDGSPCVLHYVIQCDAAWQTLGASVRGWRGDQSINVDIEVDAARRWRMNDVEVPAVEGCIDIDLNFSPTTNILPLRRLNLAIGREASTRAAWLRFPSLALEPLDQTYRRLSESAVHYESATGYTTDIEVDAEMFVVNYPGVWKIENT
jgi:hypothetical protein